MIKVSLVPPFSEEDIAAFSDIPGLCIRWGHISDAAVILGTPDPEMIRTLPQLQWLQSTSAGVDPYIAEKDAFYGKILTTTSGAFGASISEYVLAMVLELQKKLNLYRDNQSRSFWNDEGIQMTPRNKRLLVFGTGDIGCRVAKLFSIFHCQCIGVRRQAGVCPEPFERVVSLDRAEEELPQADILVCAMPHTRETCGYFDRRRLGLLKKSAILVNVGRGGFIDTDALTAVLQDHRIYGAAMDVTDPEPLPQEHPLWKCKNAVITPHISGMGFGHLKETQDIIFDICKENLKRYISGEELLNRVDFETEYRKPENRYETV